MNPIIQAYRNIAPEFVRNLVREGIRFSRDALHISQYATPNILSPSVPLSKSASDSLNALRRDGVTAIYKEEYAQVADYLLETWFPIARTIDERSDGADAPAGTSYLVDLPDDRRMKFIDVNNSYQRDAGLSIAGHISLSDPNIQPFALDPDLLGICYNYLRRQPYFRHDAELQESCFTGKNKTLNSLFHTDRMHNLSVMMLCNDIDVDTTHLEYAAGSNNRSLLLGGIGVPEEKCEEAAKKHKMVNGVGKKGTALIFDASGYHRVVLKKHTLRQVMFLNINSGHHMLPMSHQISDYINLDAPHFVKKALRL